MKGLGVVALFLPVVVRHASAQTGNQTNYFINPQQADAVDWYADNNAYAIGSSIQLQWKTNYTGISVTLWQVDSPHCSYITPPGVFVRQTLAWPVSPDKFDIYNANLTSPNVFYFTVISDSGDTPDAFMSHYFNITAAAAPSNTSSSATPVPTTAAAAASTASASQSAPAASASSSSSNSSSSNNNSKIAYGAGISVGVAAALLIGLATAFLLRRRRSSRAAHTGTGVGERDASARGWYADAPRELLALEKPKEMLAVERSKEVSGSEVRYELAVSPSQSQARR
ncbi:hypothetical protein LTR50_002551 [Elasticomyces elasticus]|nr:hypothetical protein LTR50_002551 [Elasticomyces elasticus]